LQNINEVNFSGIGLRDNLWIAFIAEKRQLQRINLSNTKVSDHGLTMLLHSDVNRITELRLNNLRIDNYAVIGRFFAHEKCRRMTVL
jgi:hypothetical protein